MITRLSVTSIYVLDKEEALDFYVAKLGLEKGNDVQQGDPSTEISLEQPGPGSLWQQHPDPPAGEVASAGCPSSCT
jgi:catechol 2,3-dioxygenase-like lactoylglutathione lyase family enzyme